MAKNIIIKNGDRYAGKFVATRSFRGKEVVCSGSSIKKVYAEAKKMGVKDPVVFFAPKKGMTHLY